MAFVVLNSFSNDLLAKRTEIPLSVFGIKAPLDPRDRVHGKALAALLAANIQDQDFGFLIGHVLDFKLGDPKPDSQGSPEPRRLVVVHSVENHLITVVENFLQLSAA